MQLKNVLSIEFINVLNKQPEVAMQHKSGTIRNIKK